ncbi:MAG: ORF6N domain-containing protein [Chitinophagaceae bacterium]|nr:ORF6N domain-containing protein [Chitinophagaceae bacterium]
MTKTIKITDDLLLSKILDLRGQKVMIDRDMAELYGVPTKRLNEQVKRNLKRFPADFMFQLTEEEKGKVVANCDHLQNLKYSASLPYAFTEHGAVMLASVLNSERAIAVNVRIVKLFNAMREVLRTNQGLLLKLEQIDKHLKAQGHTIQQHNEEIGVLFELIDELRKAHEQPPVRNPIGFKPQPFQK